MTEKQMFDYLVSNGLTEVGAAAALGNFKAESNLNPKNLQNSFNTKFGMSDDEYTKAVDDGSYKAFSKDSGGYGLAQWTFSGRKLGLLNFAKKAGTSIGDAKMQLDYFLSEVKGYKSVYEKLTKEGVSIDAATIDMMVKYEKPADQSDGKKWERVDLADDILKRCSKPAEKEVVTLTEDDIRNLFVLTGEKYVGANEEDKSHWPIIDTYNSYKPLPRGYKVKYTDPWCATFASVVAMVSGMTDIIPVECSCSNLIKLFKDMDCWVENDAYVPKPGDYIFYDWDDNGIGDNLGYPEHVGIVKAVIGNTIKVLEGNINDAVGYRNIAVNGKGIRGFGCPKFNTKATVVAKKPNTGVSKEVKWKGKVVNCSKLNVRKWAGRENDTLTSRGPLNANDIVEVCDIIQDKEGKPWYYICIDKRTYGFVSSEFIKEV